MGFVMNGDSYSGVYGADEKKILHYDVDQGECFGELEEVVVYCGSFEPKIVLRCSGCGEEMTAADVYIGLESSRCDRDTSDWEYDAEPDYY